jgi:hypothetical protein
MKGNPLSGIGRHGGPCSSAHPDGTFRDCFGLGGEDQRNMFARDQRGIRTGRRAGCWTGLWWGRRTGFASFASMTARFWRAELRPARLEGLSAVCSESKRTSQQGGQNQCHPRAIWGFRGRGGGGLPGEVMGEKSREAVLKRVGTALKRVEKPR